MVPAHDRYSENTCAVNGWWPGLMLYSGSPARWHITDGTAMIGTWVSSIPAQCSFHHILLPPFVKGYLEAWERKIGHFVNPVSALPLSTQPHSCLRNAGFKIKNPLLQCHILTVHLKLTMPAFHSHCCPLIQALATSCPDSYLDLLKCALPLPLDLRSWRAGFVFHLLCPHSAWLG